MNWPGGARFALSLTYDIEMCTNFPYWTAVWDHRKGAIDGDTRRYVAALADLAADLEAPLQFFVVGAAVAAHDVDYLLRLVQDGHAVGNHTWNHVNVKAKSFEALQVTYRQDSTLARGCAEPLEAITREVRRTSEEITRRLGVAPAGFRTPGGFAGGLADAPEVQELLAAEGFAYVSSDYRFPISGGREAGWDELVAATRWSLETLQPYRYPNGLLEIPMMGVSDIWAFRGRDMERREWLELLEAGVELAAEEGWLYSVLMHPAVQAARDPHLATLRRVIAAARDRGAWIATNDAVAALYNDALAAGG